MAKYPGLTQRDGIWYVRKRVPNDLAAIDRRGSVRRSLGTGDRKEALRLYPHCLAEIASDFDRVRAEIAATGNLSAGLTLGRIEKLGRSEIEQLVSGWWSIRAAVGGEDVELPDTLEGIANLQEVERWIGHGNADGADAVATVADRLLVQAGFASAPHRVGAITTDVDYPKVDRRHPSYRYLRELVERGLRTEEALALDRARGKRTATYDPIFNPTSNKTGSTGSLEVPRTVQDLITNFRAERVVVHGEESTARKYDLLFRIVREVWGPDLPVRQIDRAKCVEVLDFLRRLPPNATKRFPRLSLREAVAKAEAAGLARLADTSVGSYLQGLNAILSWGELADWGTKPLAKDLIKGRQPRVKRRGFAPDELATLFNALVQFRDIEPSKYWVPALALMTGARAGELCQLRKADVINVDGVSCLDLSVFDPQSGKRIEGKRLKTAASARYAPLHRGLIDAGFLDFARQTKTDRLFPELRPGVKGIYSHNFSKWFGRFKGSVGFTEPSLVFHSFRHGFRDACREAEISEETALALGGWASVNQASRYGRRGAVPVLHRAVQRLTFGGFTLPKIDTAATPTGDE